MKVKFYNLSKRTKSTKQPTGDGTELTVYWKEATSILNPTILCSTDISGYNYCYIPAWNRYYHYADLKTVENMWEVNLSEDPFSSWKTAITGTRCNIMYATGATKNIVDQRIPVTADLIVGHEEAGMSHLLPKTDGTGSVIVGITGRGSFGPYLLVNPSDVDEMLDGIDTSLWSDPMDYFKQAAYGNSASQCFKNCIGLPYILNASEIQGGTPTPENLQLGNYPCLKADSTPIQGFKIDKPIVTYTESISVPWQSTDWRRISQYSSVVVYVPLLGLFTIPATEAQYDSVLDIKISINVTSGDISMIIAGQTTGKHYVAGSGNCAIPQPYGNTGYDSGKMLLSTITGLGATVAGAASIVFSGGATIPALAAVGGGFLTFATGSISAAGGNGAGSAGLGGGAAAGLGTKIHCWVTQKQLTDTQANFNPIMGKPYMGVSTPGSFSGYVQTDGFQIEAAGMYESEREAINSGMDSGVYIE